MEHGVSFSKMDNVGMNKLPVPLGDIVKVGSSKRKIKSM